MKKILLFLAMACLVPFMGQAQQLSTGKVDKAIYSHESQVAKSSAGGFSTTAAPEVSVTNQEMSAQDAEKMAKEASMKQEVAATSADYAPFRHVRAFNVNNGKGATSNAMIAFNTDMNHFVLNDPAGAQSWGTAGPEFMNSGEYMAGMYYASTSQTHYFMMIDPETGALTQINSGNAYTAIAYNPENNQMYGIASGADAGIYTVDPSTGEGTNVGQIAVSNFVLGATISNDGRLFIIDAEIDGISEIDLETGELISSIPAGFTVNYGQDVSFDRETNQLYWAALNADAGLAILYLVDYTAQTMEEIGQFASQASCFAIMSDANPNIPAAPTDLVLTPGADNSLQCSLSWTNPSTTMGGDPLTALTHILVKRNGELIQDFENPTPGEAMTYEDNAVPAPGVYSYTVKAVSAEGEGGQVGGSVTIGDVCNYRFELVDSWGDGWNGNGINVLDANQNVVAYVTIANGANATIEVPLTVGEYSLEWVPGNYSNECSFEVYYPWNELMFEGAAQNGVFFNWTNTCTPPSCPRPSDLATSNVSNNSATLAWTENGEATTWDIEYGAPGFAHGEGTMVQVTENPYTLEGLEPGTAYQVWVRSVCGDDDISDWIAKSVGFQTAVQCPDGFTPVIATIGAGTDGTYQLPMNTFYKNSLVQELYTAEELQAQGAFFGNINTVSFQYTAEDAYDMAPSVLDIYMATTDVENLDGGWVTEGLQLVYSGTDFTMDNSGPDHYVDFQLQTQFAYDGASNLVVVFNFHQDDYLDSEYRFYTHSTEGTMARHLYTDNGPYDPFAPSGTGNALTKRNNMRFGMCITNPEYVTVSGQVTSTYTNQPVANASVDFKGALGSMVTTDENGEYSLDLVQNFNYNVVINAQGFNTYNEVYTAPANAQATKDFAINQPDITVNPTEVTAEVYFMNQATQEVTIHNAGTGELTWNASAVMDDAEKAEDSQAHVALGGEAMHTFTLNDPTTMTPAGFNGPEFMNTAVYNSLDGMIYFATSTSFMYGTIDFETGATTTITAGVPFAGIGFNGADGQLYGASLGQGATIYTVEPATGAATEVVTITSPDAFVLAMDFAEEQCVIIDATAGTLAGVDLTTGEVAALTPSQFGVNYGQDIEYDGETKTMYWAAYNTDAGGSQLWALNMETAEMTKVGDFADQASCFSIEAAKGGNIAGPWLTVAPKSGNVAAGGDGILTVNMDGWHADNGTFTGHVELTNNSVNPMVNIPVTFTILPPPCEMPTNFAGEVVDFNNIALSWTGTANAIAYNLYYYGEHEPFAVVDGSESNYVDEGLKPGHYVYQIRAMYEDGCISMSPDSIGFDAVQPYRSISGVVTSSLTNNPVANATVTFDGTTYLGPRTIVAMTGEDGSYQANVFDGTYGVTVVAQGFITATAEGLEVVENIENYNFALNQPLVTIEPMEVNVETGYMNQGVADVTITNNGNGDFVWSAATNTFDKGPKSLESVAHAAMDVQFYNFTLNDPATMEDAGFTGPEFMNTSVYADGVTYFATSGGLFGIIDFENGAVNTIKSGVEYGGIGYNPAAGTLYGVTLGDNASYYTVDAETGDAELIVQSAQPNFVLGTAASADGRIFVIDAEIHGISEVNLETGEYTTVWTGGFQINYGQDMEFDYEDNMIYWAAFNTVSSASELYQINPETNEGTMIGTFGIQQASAFSIETDSYSWLTVAPKSGVVAPGETATFQLMMDGWYAETGTFHGECVMTTNSITPVVNIPVTFTINASPCATVENFDAELVDFNNAHLTWQAPAEPEGLQSYAIYHGDERVPFAQVDPSETEYTEEGLTPDKWYFYRVRAMYEDGCVSMSPYMDSVYAVQPYGTVMGTVTDATSGEAIPGATVKFNNQFIATTDEDGTYSMDVNTGVYQNIKVSASGYLTTTIESFEVVVGENTLNATLAGNYPAPKNVAVTNCETAPVITWQSPVGKAMAEEILNENFDAVPVDGIPEGWTNVDVDAQENGWINLGMAGFEESACMTSMSYINYVGPQNPDNYLFTPLLSINGGTLTYKVCAQDAAYPAEHYGVYISTSTDPADCELLFEETLTAKAPATKRAKGMNAQGAWYDKEVDLSAYSGEYYIAFRHFDVTDQYMINLDNVVVETSPAAANNLTGYNLLRNGEMLAELDATTLTYTDNNAPEGDKTYCVVAVYEGNESAPACVDCGITPSEFNPVQNLAVENCDANPTLTWAAPAAKAAAAEILNENFDNAQVGSIPEGWTSLDEDGDGYDFHIYGAPGVSGVDGTECVSSASWDAGAGALTPDNYLFTPVLNLSGSQLTYMVAAQDAAYPYDHYGVFVSPTLDPADCELVFDETLTAKNAPATKEAKGMNVQGTWYARTIDLSAYEGEYYIAFRHYDCTDAFMFNIDNVVVTAGGVTPPVTNLTGYNVTRNGEVLATLDANTLTYTDNNAPEGDKTYCVVAVYGENMSDPACVECPATPSAFNPVQNLAVENCDANPTLTWAAPATKAAAEEILNENFDAVIPSEWTIVDVDGDGYMWEYGSQMGVDATGCMTSASYDNFFGPLTPDNYIFTPVLNLSGSTLTYMVCAQDAAWPAEHYGIYVSTTTDPADCILVFEETLTAKNAPATKQAKGMNVQGTWYEKTVDLSAYEGEYYIAFRHFNSTDNFMMNVDNVVVTTGGVTPPVTTLTGYNVLRNGEVLATLDANTLTYTDNNAPEGDKTYCVVAVYGENMSDPVCVECQGTEWQIGDVNHDGTVTLADLQMLLAYIVQNNPQGFYVEQADVNGDGVINLGDMQAMINIILGNKSNTCEIPEVSYTIEGGYLYINTTAPVSALQIAFTSDEYTPVAFDGYMTGEGYSEDGYLFVACNINGKSFPAGTHKIMKVGAATVNYMLAATPCADLVEGNEKAILGINDNVVTFEVAYPNPFATSVNVPYTINDNNANVEFSVTNMNGQVIYTEKANASGTFTWTPSNQSTGVYFINVIANGQLVQKSKVVYTK